VDGSLRWRLADPILARVPVWALGFAADGSRLYVAAIGRVFVLG